MMYLNQKQGKSEAGQIRSRANQKQGTSALYVIVHVGRIYAGRKMNIKEVFCL